MKPSVDSTQRGLTLPPTLGAKPRGGRALRLTLGGLVLATAAMSWACNPYEKLVGDYNAGALDPIKFPELYRGVDGEGSPTDPKQPGTGIFNYVAATVRGQAVAYYPLPFGGRQAALTDKLDLLNLRVPNAYSFDPNPQQSHLDSDKCVKPEGYMFDRYRDAVRGDRQGNVFTKVPVETDPPGGFSYVPIVQEVIVTSKSNPCQSIKSEENLVTRGDIAVDLAPPPAGIPDAKPTGRPSGKYLLWALIDPSADVQRPDMKLDPVTGLGPQRWGWYQRYLTAYLDGGYIPTQVNSPAGKLRMATQNVYYPTLIRDKDTNMDVDAELGMGKDIFEFKRGEDGYSPVCKVMSFEPKDTMSPETSVAEIDPATIKDTGTYIYCIQAP